MSQSGESNESDDGSGHSGLLVVVSGPSGSGKSTIVRRVVALPGSRTSLSVSATTRAPRPGEEHGRDYFFMGRDEFEAARDRGEMIEWAEVHGNDYGTPAGPVERTLATGGCVLLEIDVQGAFQVVDRYPGAVLIFVNTPSFSVLEDRLRGRLTEDEATIQRRLANARREIARSDQYHHQIINEDLDRAVDDLASLLSRLGCGGAERDA